MNNKIIIDEKKFGEIVDNACGKTFAASMITLEIIRNSQTLTEEENEKHCKEECGFYNNFDACKDKCPLIKKLKGEKS